jgi:hypothetical protein
METEKDKDKAEVPRKKEDFYETLSFRAGKWTKFE